MAAKPAAPEKSTAAFRTISEASEVIGVPQHVLRFWETRFPQLQPLKRGGNRRYYRPADMALLESIRAMLHDQGLTIRGARLALAAATTAAAAPAPETPGATPVDVPQMPAAMAGAAPFAGPETPANAPESPAGTPAIDPAKLHAICDRLRFALAA